MDPSCVTNAQSCWPDQFQNDTAGNPELSEYVRLWNRTGSVRVAYRQHAQRYIPAPGIRVPLLTRIRQDSQCVASESLQGLRPKGYDDQLLERILY